MQVRLKWQRLTIRPGNMFQVQRGKRDLPISSPGWHDEPEVATRPSLAWDATYHLVNTPELFDKFLSELKSQPRFAVDLETTSLEPRRADIVGLAFCWQTARHGIWRCAARRAKKCSTARRRCKLLKPLLEDAASARSIRTSSTISWSSNSTAFEVAGVAGDPMVADYLLHAGERSHNMEVLAEKHLNHQVIPITDLIGKGKNQKRMDEVPTAQVAEYSGEDADVAWRLCANAGTEAARGGRQETLRRSGNPADRSAGRAGIQRHPPGSCRCCGA